MIGVGRRRVIAVAVDILRHVGGGGAGEGARLGVMTEFRGKLVDTRKAAERREIHGDGGVGGRFVCMSVYACIPVCSLGGRLEAPFVTLIQVYLIYHFLIVILNRTLVVYLCLSDNPRVAKNKAEGRRGGGDGCHCCISV